MSACSLRSDPLDVAHISRIAYKRSSCSYNEYVKHSTAERAQPTLMQFVTGSWGGHTRWDSRTIYATPTSCACIVSLPDMILYSAALTDHMAELHPLVIAVDPSPMKNSSAAVASASEVYIVIRKPLRLCISVATRLADVAFDQVMWNPGESYLYRFLCLLGERSGLSPNVHVARRVRDRFRHAYHSCCTRGKPIVRELETVWLGIIALWSNHKAASVRE